MTKRKRDDQDGQETSIDSASEGTVGVPDPVGPPVAPPSALVKRGREMTCSEYVRGKGPVGTAFEVTMKLTHKRTLKHTKDEWDSMFQAFQGERR